MTVEEEKEFDWKFSNTKYMNLDRLIINTNTLLESTHRIKLKEFINELLNKRESELIEKVNDFAFKEKARGNGYWCIGITKLKKYMYSIKSK